MCSLCLPLSSFFLSLQFAIQIVFERIFYIMNVIRKTKRKQQKRETTIAWVEYEPQNALTVATTTVEWDRESE